MVDLYKKILANQTDELAEALIEQKKEALGLPVGEVHTDKSMK